MAVFYFDIGIVEFVSSGPKSYAFKCKDGYTVIKIKGVSLKYGHRNLLNFEVMKKVILEMQENDISITVPVPQWGFVYKINDGIRKHNSFKNFKFNDQDMKGELVKVTTDHSKPKNFIAPFGYNICV